MELDRHDCNAIAAAMQALEGVDGLSNVRINTVTFTVYGEHRVRASRRGRWNPLRISKIEKIRG